MKFQYCPYCKSDLIEKNKFYVCKKNDHKTYKNNIPAAAIVLIKEGKVLLSRRAIEPRKGKWDVIGGFIEAGETPIDAAKRETLEESNLKIEILDQIGLYMDKYKYNGDFLDVMLIYFVAKIIGGKEQPADDVSELKWFDINNLPEKEFAFEHLKHGLADVKKWIEENKLDISSY